MNSNRLDLLERMNFRADIGYIVALIAAALGFGGIFVTDPDIKALMAFTAAVLVLGNFVNMYWIWRTLRQYNRDQRRDS